MELPRLEPLHQKLKSEGVSFIAIEATNEAQAAVEFIEKHKLTYNFLDNPKGEDDVCRGKYGIRDFPSAFIINEEGKAIYMHYGFEEGDEVKIEEEIRSLLK